MTVVTDTNVLLVANLAHPNVSPECVMACIGRLHSLMHSGSIAIDDQFRILREYQKKTSPRKGMGAGDVFLKWPLSQQSNRDRVHQVSLAESSENCFAEFPVPELEDEFDPPDRKFAAVAAAHREKPSIWQATDSKWLV